MQHGEGTLCLPLASSPSSRSLSLFLSLFLSLSRPIISASGRTSFDRPPTTSISCSVRYARGSRPGEIIEPSRTDWNLRLLSSESKARNRRVAIAMRSFRPTFLRSSIHSEYDETVRYIRATTFALGTGR